MHALYSPQGTLFAVWTQPCSGSQTSSVQGLASSHAGVWTQPVAGMQLSSVHASWSSQSGGLPAMQPEWLSQCSNPLQASPSSQFSDDVPKQTPPTHRSPSVQTL